MHIIDSIEKKANNIHAKGIDRAQKNIGRKAGSIKGKGLDRAARNIEKGANRFARGRKR